MWTHSPLGTQYPHRSGEGAGVMGEDELTNTKTKDKNPATPTHQALWDIASTSVDAPTAMKLLRTATAAAVVPASSQSLTRNR